MHATCVLLGQRAVLIRGSVGAGKSDLALRLISSPAPAFAHPAAHAILVADDIVRLHVANARLIASPPPEIAGKLEVRGVGIVNVDYCERAEVCLLVDLAHLDDIPRMPDEPSLLETIHGASLPRISLYPFEPSAPVKLWLALYRLA